MAKVNIDKEVLIKHHFWILAGLIAVLVLFGFLWVATSVAGDNDAEKKVIADAEKDAVPKDKEIRNQKFLKALQTQSAGLEEQKTKNWRRVWKNQKDLFDWPAGTLQNKLGRLPFGSPIGTVTEYRDLPDEYGKTYRRYVTGTFEGLIEPTQYGGSGNTPGKWYDVVRHVSKNEKDNLEFDKLPPDDEDIWLSLEDVWVQRELLRAVRETNDEVAWLAPLEQARLPEGVKQADVRLARSFYNSYWQLDLAVDKENRLHSTITNIGKRRQPLGASFWVQVQDDPRLKGASPDVRDKEERGRLFAELPLNYQTRGVGESYTAPVPRNLKDNNPTGLFRVWQELKVETAPVKRVDRLDLTKDALCDRHGKRQLVARARAGGGEGGEEGADKGEKKTQSKNGLDTVRYLEATEQVRRMPVMLVVIVEQDRVQNLLRRLATSRLRIQTTQVQWQHHDPTAGEGGRRGVGVGVGTVDTRGQGRTEAQRDQDSNLVELTFHGIASLYERAPEEKKEGQ